MRGFSLVEMLVAIAVFALIATASLATVRFAVDSRSQIRERSERLAVLQRAHGLLKADIGQSVRRKTRDETGRRFVASFYGNGSPAPTLGVVRGGWENAFEASRPSLQSVEWRVEDDELRRSTRSALDGAQREPPTVVLEGVTNVQFEFLLSGEWLTTFVSTPTRPAPDAVRVTLTVEDFGPVQMTFLPAVAGPAT